MYDYVDLYLQAAVEGQIQEVPEEMVLPMELELMDCIAVKTAGDEHLVVWEASEEMH